MKRANNRRVRERKEEKEDYLVKIVIVLAIVLTSLFVLYAFVDGDGEKESVNKMQV